MKILFMGTPFYAKVILEAIFNAKHEIVGVFTQPDKPVGRKQIITFSHVKEFALQNNLQIFQPKSLKDEAIISQIRHLNADIILVAAYGMILPKAVLQIAPCVNLHASILPKYRGASPIQSAILNGETKTGVTAMLMDEGLDTGEMLDFIYTPILPTSTSEELFETLSFLAAKLSVKVLENFHALKPIKQDDSQSSYAKKISKEDGEVDFTKESAMQIERKFRAFYPWPGIYLPNKIKIISCELADFQGEAKKILRIEKDAIIVSCKQGSLKLKTLQAPSKKPVNAYEFIQGMRKKLGDYLY